MASTIVNGTVCTLLFLLEDDDAEDVAIDDEQNLILLAACAVLRKDRPKIENYTEEVVPQYFLDDFKRFFRVSRSTFELICRNIAVYQELLPSWTGGRQPISVEKQLLIMLYYISGQETLNRIADRFNTTESSVVRCRDKIFHVFLNYLKSKFIIWPDGNEKRLVIQGFQRKANFPGVVGAVDGTHIEIKAPKEHPETYVNRKGYHSIILQGTCREDMRFIHTVAGWPGSCHDSRVLRNSDLWERGPALCGDAHIVGDAAYPLQKWLITPYRDTGNLTQIQRRFNTCHSVTRVTVERAFGLLKGRFRRLQYIDTHNIRTAVDLILVCCILHNICIINEDEMEDYFDDNMIQPQPNIVQQNNNVDGNRKRDQIAQQL